MKRKLLAIATCAALITPALAVSQTSGAQGSGPAASGSSGPVNYSPSMSRLLEAADRLREAIQAMAQQPAGERRNDAIQRAQEAFTETQAAMMELPPELRSGAGAGTQPNYTKSMERLQQAAQKLRESVQAMAQQPAGDRRNQAADAAREALLETQQAMVMLPTDLRTGSSTAGK